MILNSGNQMTRKHIFSQYYTKHHQEGKRRNFVFGGAERGQLFARWIGVGKKILDLGCRDGALTEFYSHGNDIVGVDIDKEALEQCHKRLGIKTIWLNLNEPFLFESASFEIVVAGEILEHTIFPEVVIAEVNRVLQNQGIFIGSVPNAFRLKNRIKFLLGKDYETDKTHLHHFSISSLKDLLEKYFTSIEIHPISGKFVALSPKLFANDLVWRCVKK